jgi:hypothetical protein
LARLGDGQQVAHGGADPELLAELAHQGDGGRLARLDVATGKEEPALVDRMRQQQLVIETETAVNWLPFAAGRLYPGQELNADGSNWWALNRAALEGLLGEAGFARTEVLFRSSVPRRVARAGREALRGQGSFRMNLRSARIVVHAFR